MSGSERYFPEVARTALAIRQLRIQGAINVARRSLMSLGFYMRRASPDAAQLRRHVELLRAQRPTEPALQNCLDAVLAGESCDALLRLIDLGAARIGENGAPLVKDGSTVMTHCHSSSVIGILKDARAAGTRFRVYHTETRPLYQGRRTARELVAARIRATMFVDSAVNYFMPEADIVMVGADALLPGGFINKIGTSQMALSAASHHKPLYVVCGLLKFSRKADICIERRPPEELGFRLPGLGIENPAFDFTPARHVRAVVCEGGVLPFGKAVSAARRGRLFSSGGAVSRGGLFGADFGR